MLDTVLNIGKIFREAGELKHHRYVKQGYSPDSKIDVLYLNIPVDKEMNFDLAQGKEIPENKRNTLYYLNFKTSDADSLKKYIFGDIYRSYIPNKKDPSKDKEDGNYRFGDPNVKAKAFTLSSFFRGEDEAQFFVGTKIENFRTSFKKQIKQVEKLIKDNNNIYLHFDFSGKHWYQLTKEFNLINRILFESFVKYKDKVSGYVLEKFLYKTLSNSVIGLPNNSLENIHKTKYFKNAEEVMDLLYAIDYSTKAIMTRGPIKIIALPRSEQLSPESIEDFFSKKNLREHEIGVTNIHAENENSDEEDSLSIFTKNSFDTKATQFDLILSKASSSPSSPDVDLIEISRINKDYLVELYNKIQLIRNEIRKNQSKLFDNSDKVVPPSIFFAFKNILGDVTKEKKRYHSHLLKVLPKIYTGTYYRDDILLPAFIDKVQFNIRKDQGNYNFLKFDYFFLTKLQGENNMEKMEESASYQVGLLLGRMANPLGRKIASFEKAYVGLLSRRISGLKDLKKFSNFINEKLNIHNVAYKDLKKAYLDIVLITKKISDSNYNRDYCSFGFFEGYYTFYKDIEEKIDEQEKKGE